MENQGHLQRHAVRTLWGPLGGRASKSAAASPREFAPRSRGLNPRPASHVAIVVSISRIRGARKSGRRAISAKVSPGEMKTPRKRAEKDLGAGSSGASGSTGGALITESF